MITGHLLSSIARVAALICLKPGDAAGALGVGIAALLMVGFRALYPPAGVDAFLITQLDLPWSCIVMRLQGKVALLTGAAAAIKGELMGFGGAAAHVFVREGARVVLTDIRDELGERSAVTLRADGHDARDMHLDVTSEQNWGQVVDAVMAAHNRLDVLFNNAGVSFPGKVEDIHRGGLGT